LIGLGFIILAGIILFIVMYRGRMDSENSNRQSRQEALTTVAATLAWDPPIASSTPTPSPSPGYSVTRAYKLYYGTAPRTYSTVLPVSGDSFMVTVAGLSTDTQYYFGVTATETTCWPPPAPGCQTAESGYSNEVAWIAPSPTPPAPIAISGTIAYCSNPASAVTVSLGGDVFASTLTDATGHYSFDSLPSGGTYIVTPSKAALPPGSAGIDTVDVLAVHQYVFQVPARPCLFATAEVTGDQVVNTVDVIAVQKFFIGGATGYANVGKHGFTPSSRSYQAVVNDQTAQDFDGLLLGDVAAPFVP
jgi:hypothetical protein